MMATILCRVCHKSVPILCRRSRPSAQWRDRRRAGIMLVVRRIALPLAAGGLAATLAAGLALAARAPAAPSGLHGVVYRGPTTPVCREGVPCEAPAPGVTLFFGRSGVRKGAIKTRADGSYRILLPAAIYAVTTDQGRFERTPYPHRIKVRLEHVDTLDFRIDTGIR